MTMMPYNGSTAHNKVGMLAVSVQHSNYRPMITFIKPAHIQQKTWCQ